MLYLFNTTICPNEGVFINRKVSKQFAYDFFWKYGFINTAPSTLGVTPQDLEPTFISAIGHQGSADAFNAIMSGSHVQVNRIQAELKPGDQALCLKVIGRVPEGQILTLEELERIGFEFYLMTNIGANFNEDGSIINSHLGYLTPELNYVHKS